MEPTQQSGTTRTARQAGKVTPSPIVHARDLVASVIAKSGQKLFGATATFGPSSFRGEATISGGNVAAFLQERINYFGLDGITVPANAKHLDDAIMAVAAQVAQKSGTKGELNADQVERITLEYVTSSCFVAADQVESFASYLDRSRKMRVAIKDVNAAAQTSEQQAFAKDQAVGAIAQLIEAGTRAWATVATLLATSLHLRTLRTTIVSPILYASVGAWKTVQEIDQRTRQAVLAELTAMIGENGNPFVAEAEIARASARVQGNLLLSSGTPFGVSATTVIRALEQTRRADVTKNGGSKVELKGATPADIGRQIAGLNGGIDMIVERQDDKTLRMALTIREGLPTTAPFTAMVPAPVTGRQQSAAYAS
ncbi:MAG: hypothetical protein Q8R16_00640 [bacterium]|nr:hypothetical protein [bacterium]